MEKSAKSLILYNQNSIKRKLPNDLAHLQNRNAEAEMMLII